ncbi:MAG TPA: hypothetical protein VIF64_13495 [Pyrinomonadaceae bacterium]|jgi:hypothetical protein
MDGLTVFFILFFGIAAVIPAVWAIVGLIQGNTRYWPAVAGTGFAVALLLVTIIGAAINWGGCPVNGGSSEGAVQCFASGSSDPSCKPDVWKIECGQSVSCGDPPTALPAHTFCPAGQTTVFEFCEKIQTGGIKQPWATWSDLSFIASGLWLLWFFHYFPRPGEYGSGTTLISVTADNPMIMVGWLSVTYGFIVIFMGPPSQWFHASMKDWGGWFDAMSVVAWLMFNAVYVIFTLAGPMWGNLREYRTLAVLLIWGGLMIGSGIIAALIPDSRTYLYFAGGGPWGIAEVIYVFVGWRVATVRYRRTWWLFIINLTVLAITMGIWVFFNPAIKLFTPPAACHTREGFPGHALFHILASVATMLTFASFASEQEKPPSP